MGTNFLCSNKQPPIDGRRPGLVTIVESKGEVAPAAEAEQAAGAANDEEGDEAELARVLERQSHLTRAVASLAERLEAMERRRGQSSAIPGQARESRAAGADTQPASIWKGVI